MALPQFQIKRATKTQSRLRLSIAGPSGSGKTYTALRLASVLGQKIGFIDTERGSASKYADEFEFDVIELDDFHPQSFIGAIKTFEQAGYDLIIIDSTTHEWNGTNGILELHEVAVAKQRTKNNYTAWAEVTPLHTDFINAILQSRCHIIASVRSKTEYVQEKNDRGQTEIRKVGMASIQRADMDYEYDVMLELDVQHTGVITKTRCAALDGKVFKKPGNELAQILKHWLTDGVSAEQPKADLKIVKNEPTPVAPPLRVQFTDATTANKIIALWETDGVTTNRGRKLELHPWLSWKRNVTGLAALPATEGAELLDWLEERKNTRLAAEAERTNTPEDVLTGEVSDAPRSSQELLSEAMQAAKDSGLTQAQIAEKMVQDGLDGELTEDQMSELAATLNAWSQARKELP